MARQGSITLDVPSLLNSLGTSLYTDQTVALRELLQNAHDAIAFYRRELRQLGKTHFTPEVSITYRATELEVFDNGIGMSDGELEEEFSRVGRSPKQDLELIVDSRGGLGERIIGQYGIGFLAAFLVADRVDVFSRRDGGQGHHWWCSGDAYYNLEEADLDFERGTRVVLKLKPSEELPREFLSIEGIKELVARYGSLLQVPLYVQNTLINRFAPYWESPESFMGLREADLHEFLRERFPVEFLDTFRVSQTAEHIQHGDLSFRAALFIGKVGAESRIFRGTPMEQAATGVDIYVKGMFVCRSNDFLPSWAGFVHGAVDFDNLKVSLSREEVVEDDLCNKYRSELEQRILERLRKLKGTDKLRGIVDLHRPDLVQGVAMLGDRKLSKRGRSLFDELAGIIPFKTSQGAQTIQEYLRAVNDAAKRFRDCEENTLYCVPQKGTGAAEAMLAEDRGWPVIFMVAIEQKVLRDFVNQHDELTLKVMDPEDFFFDKEKQDEDRAVEALFRQEMAKLNLPKLEYRVRRFRRSVPALLLVAGERQEAAEKLFRALEQASQDSRLQGSGGLEMLRRLARQYRSEEGQRYLYINADNEIVRDLVQIYTSSPHDESLLLACRTIYHSALLQSAHRSLTERDAQIVIENFNETLAVLINKTLEESRAGAETVVAAEETETDSGLAQVAPFVFCIHPFNDREVDAAMDLVKRQLREAPFTLEGLSASDEVRELTVSNNVRELARNCLFGVADITGNNPNVMLEIGMLEMLGKPVVKIRNAHDDTSVPIDIREDLYCSYTTVDLGDGKIDVGAAFARSLIKHLQRAYTSMD